MRWSFEPLLSLALVGCGPERLAHVDGATRIAETGAGEVLVGTESGSLYLVDSFGGASRIVDTVGAAVVDLGCGPLGACWVLTKDGRVLQGAPWLPPRVVREGAIGMTVDCKGVVVGTHTDPGLWEGATTTVVPEGCDRYLRGSAQGLVDGTSVSDAAIVRIEPQTSGFLSIDEKGRTGCLGCSLPVPSAGVLDACTMHAAPFVEGEVVWLDRNGDLWVR